MKKPEEPQDDWTDPVGAGEDEVVRYIVWGICVVVALGIGAVILKVLERVGLF